jgi:hypothetical protein
MTATSPAAPTALPSNITDDRRLSRRQATAYLREHEGLPVGDHTLDRLASVGGGPRFALVGRSTIYPVKDLREWAREQTAVTYASRAEARAAKMRAAAAA